MEHDQATRMGASERYLLGDLTDAERDQFEEHFFDCPACAQEVEAGVMFEANARAVFAEEARRPAAQPTSWWDWVRLRPAFAGAAACLVVALAGGFGYMSWLAGELRTETAALRAPQSYPFTFLPSVTRGDGKVIEVPKQSRFFGLSLDPPPGQSFGQYFGEVVSESGAILFTVPLAKPRTSGDSLNLLIPASSVEPGRRYTLIVRAVEGGSAGKAGIEIARYNFITQRN